MRMNSDEQLRRGREAYEYYGSWQAVREASREIKRKQSKPSKAKS